MSFQLLPARASAPGACSLSVLKTELSTCSRGKWVALRKGCKMETFSLKLSERGTGNWKGSNLLTMCSLLWNALSLYPNSHPLGTVHLGRHGHALLGVGWEESYFLGQFLGCRAFPVDHTWFWSRIIILFTLDNSAGGGRGGGETSQYGALMQVRLRLVGKTTHRTRSD